MIMASKGCARPHSISSKLPIRLKLSRHTVSMCLFIPEELATRVKELGQALVLPSLRRPLACRTRTGQFAVYRGSRLGAHLIRVGKLPPSPSLLQGASNIDWGISSGVIDLHELYTFYCMLLISPVAEPFTVTRLNKGMAIGIEPGMRKLIYHLCHFIGASRHRRL